MLKFTEEKIPQAKAFYGRWIIAPQQPFVASYRDQYNEYPDFYAVAVTAKNKLVIFNFYGEHYVEDNYAPAAMHVVDSLEAASKMQLPDNLVSEVMKRQGIAIQELDI